MHSTGSYIGVDIGGSNTRVALFYSQESADFELLAKFPTHQSYEEQLQHIITTVQGRKLANLAGIGVSLAGRIAKDGRCVIIAPNLPAYVDRCFVLDLSDQFACPIRLAHDPVCGLLAEKKFGSIRDFERCAYLTVSTGTGAAIQLSKAGVALTSSIEIGHQILDGNQRVCLCSQVGCLETFTGGRQIALRYGHAVVEITDSGFWENFCDKLALGLINLAMLTRVDAVAISGAIALNTTQFLGQLQQKVDAVIRGATLELSLAMLGGNAPLVGAVELLTVPESTILH